MASLTIPSILRKKRDQLELSESEVQFLVDSIISEKIHDAQIGAFLMASYLNGLSQKETVALVKAMTYSGFRFTWPTSWKGSVVDKHSTGGVGDKVSLILAPCLASLGLKVPMISGRGLDFTGGTLDKLESIPGFQVALTKEQFRACLDKCGCSIMGQTSDIAPADKKIYAIRDTTATVDYENLIVASIISKKAAEGLESLVLDVKVGSGALLKKKEDARSLATKLVNAGSLFGIKTSAFITNMDTPLGKAVGNALEVAESIETLRNPKEAPSDLVELTCTLGGQLLLSIGKVSNLCEGKERLRTSLSDGSALQRFRDMLICQGTEKEVANEICFGDMWKHLPKAKKVVEITSKVEGFLEGIDALSIAKFCHGLGCGRTNPGSPVKFEPGVKLLKKPGEKVKVGDKLVEVHLPNNNEEKEVSVEDVILSMLTFSGERPPREELVMELIQ